VAPGTVVSVTAIEALFVQMSVALLPVVPVVAAMSRTVRTAFNDSNTSVDSNSDGSSTAPDPVGLTKIITSATMTKTSMTVDNVTTRDLRKPVT
jgi:hypothetical protein